MRLRYLSLALTLIFISCKKGDAQDGVPMNQPNNDINAIRSDVYDGKVSAYDELKKFYLESDPADFLYYAIFMSNAYDHPQAYLDVYDCFNNDYSGLEFKKRDKKTQELMLKYLREAIKKKVDGADERLKEIEQGNRKD